MNEFKKLLDTPVTILSDIYPTATCLSEAYEDGFRNGMAYEREKYMCKEDCKYAYGCERCIRWSKLADCYEPRKESKYED